MHTDLSLKEIQKEWHGTFKVLCDWIYPFPFTDSCFIFSCCRRISQDTHLIYTIIGLALIQAIVQLIFFLHVGQEAKPRWELIIFVLW